MNFNRYMMAAAAALFSSTAGLHAADLTYNPGDLFMGFRVTGGTGAGTSYVVNIGQASQFLSGDGSSGAATAVTPSLSGVATDLAALFGANWATRADLYWSVSGTSSVDAAVGTEPATTLIASKERPIPGQVLASTSRWQRAGVFTQGGPSNAMGALGSAFALKPGNSTPNASTANNPKGLVQTNTEINSYASFQPGGTVENSGPAPGISYAYFNPTVEGSFGKGTAGSVLELHRMRPGSGAGEVLGTLTLSNTGTLTFSPLPAPTISLSSATATVNENAGKYSVMVVRDGDISAGATVTLTVAAGTAAVGTDFTAVAPTTVTFTAGQNQQIVEVPILDRTTYQGDRTFTASLSSSSGPALGTTTQTVTIADQQAQVQFSAASADVNEDAGSVLLTLQRIGNLNQTSTVLVSTANGTATSGTDYTAVSAQTVTFTAGQTSRTVEIAIADRDGAQGDRSFTVTVSGASTGTDLGSAATSTVNIIEGGPGTISFSATTYSITEPGSGTATVTVTVNRVGGNLPITATLARTSGSATAGTDFTATLPAELSWGATDTTPKTVVITVNADQITESVETIVLGLTAGTGAPALGTASATVNITSLQHGVVNFSQANYTGAEAVSGDATYTVTATRSGGSDGAVTAAVTGSGGTATAGTDYTAINSTLSWVNGEQGSKTVTVTVKKDSDTTAAETFNLALGSFTGGLAAGTRTTAVFTITEKDDNTGPAVKIITPKANAAVSANGPTTVALEATAVDPVGVNTVVARVNGGSPVTVPLVGSSYKVNLTGLENGRNTIEVAATDADGNIGKASVAVIVSIVDATTLGAYNGLFEADAEEDAKLAALVNGPSLNHNGLLRVDVTAGQRFTGTITMAGVRLSIKGMFLSNGKAVFGDGPMAADKVELFKKGIPDDFSLGFLSLNLDKDANKITGSLTTDPSDSPIITFATVSADQNLYTDKPSPVAPFQNVPSSIVGVADGGKYTVLFESKGAPNNGYAASAYPLGDGAGTVLVDKKGVVKVLAKLADGTAVSYSNALSLQNEFPMYVQLYSSKGFIVGNVQFDPTQTATDASATVSWFRPTGITTTGNYLAGWKKGIDLDLVASKYVRPAAGAANNLLGLAPATPLIVRTNGVLANTQNQATLSALNVLNVGGAVSGAQPATGLKVTFDTATGLLKAPSEFVYGTGAVKVRVTGAVFQKKSSVAGYFLYAPARTNPVGAPESGYLEIARPATP
jgi:hypothetical protein